MKQTLSDDASSGRNGGTRRVLTSPLRGAFSITANAYLPAREDERVGTAISVPMRARGTYGPAGFSLGLFKGCLAGSLQCRPSETELAPRPDALNANIRCALRQYPPK